MYTKFDESILKKIYDESRNYYILATTHSSNTKPENIKYTADKFILVSEWSKGVFDNVFKGSIPCEVWEYPIIKVEYDKDKAKEELGFDAEVPIFDPKTKEEDKRRLKYADIYWKSRQRRGISLLDAQKWMRERNYFAAMMVNEGDADAMVSGYSRSYPSTVKPLMQLVGKAPGITLIATTNMMMTNRGPMFLSDTAINPNPTADELAKIALMTAKTVRMFGMEPVIAMVSFSNFGSSSHESATKVREAVAYLHEHYPDLIVDGEIQTDFALNAEMLKNKFPFSKLAGKKVNTLIFPNLEAANINYKLLKELYKVDSVGPIMLGMEKAVHIFQLGASVEEMVNMVAVAVVDAQEKEKRKKTTTK
jgi:malate dehydrogenase (oxaloacetate-decarboxylating)(NADP+)